MNDHTTVLGLDVHKDTIVAAVLPPNAPRVTQEETLPHTPKALGRFVRRIQQSGPIVAVYEAGPCGFTVQRLLARMKVPCEVIAPALTPVRPGDRVKTDRRDAAKLAAFYRAGTLTPIRVPTCEEEALRDLVRAREDAMIDRQRARRRLGMFLLRQGRIYSLTRSWGHNHRLWLDAQHFDLPCQEATYAAYRRSLQDAEAHEAALTQQVLDLASHPRYHALVAALRSLKGIDTLSAVTLAVEVADFRRFSRAPEFMAYTGLVVRERSSGGTTRRGSITKSGNAHVRRVLIEAAWSYRHGRVTHGPLLERRAQVLPAIAAHAREAERRLNRKFWRLVSRGRPSQVAVVAVGRELAGFVWAIARQAVPAASA